MNLGADLPSRSHQATTAQQSASLNRRGTEVIHEFALVLGRCLDPSTQVDSSSEERRGARIVRTRDKALSYLAPLNNALDQTPATRFVADGISVGAGQLHRYAYDASPKRKL